MPKTSTPTSTSTVSKPSKQFTAVSMAKAKKIANELTRFLDGNKLVIHIAGKKFVPVEGWQFVGETQMGLTSVVVSCDPVETANPKEVKYKAIAEVMNQQGVVISRGFAWCSNLEGKKKSFEEYAVASMAQTRAIGKAYRNILSWIVKMGGYEPTPAEEINREVLEEDLSKIKADVFKQFKEAGIESSTEMIDIIKKATGKEVIENSDDAMAVIAELSTEPAHDYSGDNVT